MTDAHLHQILLLDLCAGNPGAIFVMLELQRIHRFSNDYFKCCNYLKQHNIRGADLYLLWKQTCMKDYEKFIKYYFV